MAKNMLTFPLRLRRRRPRQSTVFTATAFALVCLAFLCLAWDSPVRLGINFSVGYAYRLVHDATISRDQWLWEPARYPLRLQGDVGYLLKTGYGTRHRLAAQLEAFSLSGDILGTEGRDFLVVGDWTTVNKTDADLLGAEVHNAVAMTLETKISKALSGHDRFSKYKTLQSAVDSGDEAAAMDAGARHGWELDALKFIMGMELMYHQMPGKKWYVILDDDTLVIKSSLELFLSHLDPAKPQYIGNAVGDFLARFAHGGSAVILSGEAVRQLFARPDIVAQAHELSLDETWGDKLVARTMLKLGIYLDERYSHYFNGEAPEITRISGERFCSPLLSFHGLRKPGAMVAAGRSLAKAKKAVVWGDLWGLFGTGPMESASSMSQGEDHVGATDERVQKWQSGAQSAQACRGKCEANSRWCMAWTYEESSQTCIGSPWAITGEGAADGKTSGINLARVKALQKQCRRSS